MALELLRLASLRLFVELHYLCIISAHSALHGKTDSGTEMRAEGALVESGGAPGKPQHLMPLIADL